MSVTGKPLMGSLTKMLRVILHGLASHPERRKSNFTDSFMLATETVVKNHIVKWRLGAWDIQE